MTTPARVPRGARGASGVRSGTPTCASAGRSRSRSRFAETLEAVLDLQRCGLRDDVRGRFLRGGLLGAEDLVELAGLEHLDDDVAAADELAVDDELRRRRPVR